MLANELGPRGVRCLLVDMKPGTAFNPQANATQARTMEHFRRLGIAQDIRSQGLPADYPTDIAYFTRYTRYELARLRLPAAKRAVEDIRGMGGSWSAAELPHRVSQKYVVACLRRGELLVKEDVRSWIFGIARRLCMQVRRSHAKMPSDPIDRFDLDECMGEMPGFEQPVEESLEAGVMRHLDRLTNQERLVFLEFWLEDQRIDAIAAKYGMAVSTVRNHLHAARKKLREVANRILGY